MSLKSIDHAAVGRSAARRGCDRDAVNGGRIPKVLQGFPGAVGPPALYCRILALARGSCGPDETCAGMIQGVSIWRDHCRAIQVNKAVSPAIWRACGARLCGVLPGSSYFEPKAGWMFRQIGDRKSTRLNSSH